MNAQVLHTISVVALSTAAFFAVISIILYFKLDVRELIDNLSGKSAERQIREVREQNKRLSSNYNGNFIERHKIEEKAAKINVSEKTNILPDAKTRNLLIIDKDISDTAKLDRESENTVVLDRKSEDTEVLDWKSEDTEVLVQESEDTMVLEHEVEDTVVLSQRCQILIDEMIIHTEECFSK